jgi:hypothetical protein
VTTAPRRVARIVGTALAGLIAVPTVLALVLIWVVSPLEGIDIDVDVDLAATGAGVSARRDGLVMVHAGPGRCGSSRSTLHDESVRLTEAEGPVLWQADRTVAADDAGAPPRLDVVTVGHAPPGFATVVPLAAPLDPSATYVAEISVLPSTSWASQPSWAGDDLFPLLGQSATFRPADLSTTAVSFRGQMLTPDEFEQAPCETHAEA